MMINIAKGGLVVGGEGDDAPLWPMAHCRAVSLSLSPSARNLSQLVELNSCSLVKLNLCELVYHFT